MNSEGISSKGNDQLLSTIAFEEVLKCYVQKIEQAKNSSKEKQFYEKVLQVIKDLGNKTKIEGENFNGPVKYLQMTLTDPSTSIDHLASAVNSYNALLRSESSNFLSPEGTSSKEMDVEKQKKLAEAMLRKIQSSLEMDLTSPLSLEGLSFLSTEYVCEIIILECFIKALKINAKAESKEIYFFNSLHKILMTKKWKDPGTLIEVFTRYCKHLSIQKEAAAPFISLLHKIQILGMQKAILPAPISEFGFGSVEEPSQHSAKGLHPLVELQKQLYSLLNPVIKKTTVNIRKTIRDLKIGSDGLKDRKNLSQEFLNDKTFIENSLGITQQLAGRLKIFLHYITMRNLEGEAHCEAILDPFSTDTEKRLRTDELLRNTQRYKKKIEDAFDPLKNLVNKFRRTLEATLPCSNRGEDTIFLLKIFYALLCFHNIFYVDKLKEILKNFSKEQSSCLKEENDIGKTPKIDDFFNFVISWTKLKQEGLLYPKREKNIEAERKRLINGAIIDRPIWYKSLVEHFSKQMDPFLSNFISIPGTISKDWYENFAFGKFNPISEKVTISKTCEKVIEIHTEHLLNTKSLYEKKGFIDWFDTHFSSSFFIETLISSFNESERSLFEEIHHTDHFNQWLVSVGNAMDQLYASVPLKKNASCESLNQMRAAEKSLVPINSGFDLTFNFLMPAIEGCKANIVSTLQSPEELTTAWLLSIDRAASKQKKIRNMQQSSNANAFVKSPEQTKTMSKKAPKTAMEASPLSSTQSAVVNSLPLRTHDPISGQFFPPHKIVQGNRIDKAAIFSQDQAYHLNHLLWTLELLKKAIKEGKVDQIALLGTNLIDHLYHAQEQGITPVYLARNGRLKHGLVGMSRGLESECSDDNDKGSLWVRYPHASEEHYKALGYAIPLGLKIALAFADHLNDPEKILSQIPSLIQLTKNGLNFLQEFPHPEDSVKELRVKVDEFEQSILNGLKMGKKGKKKHVKTSGQFEDFRLRLADIKEKLQTKLSQRLAITPDAKVSSFKDLIVHINRLESAIEMFQIYPQQRFLSMHEHNVRVCGQYLPEICFSVISQMEGDEFHSHYFKAARSILGLEALLSKKALIELKELNIGKGGDYIYWKHFRHHQLSKSVHPGLKNLSEAYELAIEGSVLGEGFTPSFFKQEILGKKRGHLIQLISKEIEILGLLVDKRINK